MHPRRSYNSQLPQEKQPQCGVRSSLMSDPLPEEAGCETCQRTVVLLVFMA